jgi:hypothetical protein
MSASCCGRIDSPEGDPHVKAIEVWQHNERIVVLALAGITVNDQFEEACLFFKDVTGIQIRGDATYLGWLPNRHTKEDLRRIRAWYQENSGRLYWEKSHQKVRVGAI